MENTCPLCKARFHTIDRVNTDVSIRNKRKKCDVSIGGESEDTEGGGGGVGIGVGEHQQQLAGCDGKEEEVRSSKRVRTRNQRSDVHNYSSLESIFGKIHKEREREHGGRVVVLLLAAAAPNVKLTIFEYFLFGNRFLPHRELSRRQRAMADAHCPAPLLGLGSLVVVVVPRC